MRGLRELPVGGRVRQILPAVVLGGALGAVAATVAADPSDPAKLLVVVVAALFAIALMGDVRRVLLGLALLDIPFQWDKYFGYREDVDALAALAGWNVSMTTLALVGLYAIWIVELLLSPQVAARPRLRAAAVPGTFFVLLLVSLGVAQDRDVAGFQILLYAQALLLFAYVASTTRTREDVRFIVTMLIAGLCLESLVTLAMAATGGRFEVPGIATRSTSAVGGSGTRVGGTIGSPNNAGAYFAFMSALAAAVYVSAAPARLRRLALVSCTLGLVALVLTLSRGAWIAFLVSAVVLVHASRGRRLSAPAVVTLGLMLIVVLIPLQGVVAERLGRSDEGAAASREPLLHMAGKMIEDHPLLGVGANNFVLRLPEYAGGQFSAAWLSSVHNKYLLIWAEAGAVALAAFVLFVGMTLARAWRLRTAADPLASAVGVGFAAAVAGHAVHMNFDVFAGTTTTNMLWVGAALVASPALATAPSTAVARTRASPLPATALAGRGLPQGVR